MLSSMTGYGKARKASGGREIGVELRSVNHRYFEFSARLPRSCAYMEEKLKSLVRAKVSRGKVDLSLTVTALEDPDTAVLVNRPLARGYLEALRGLGKELGVADDITLATLCRMNDIFMLRRAEPDEDALWDAVRETALEAISHYLDMRAAEGARLKEDIEERLSAILLLVARVEERSPLTTEEYRARLYNKLLEVLEGRQPDDQRILTEAAIFAEKTAVAEETVRLKSHVSQLREILSAGDAMGRKLDFLVQELNREANTVGSKCQDLEIARIVVDMKSEIEKIREQIQNIE
ncbi:MAG: YicC family protein [Oscillospiraceae bacterium]|nr:YicC family protein [Oscillospiraceae bacterium]